MFSGGGVGLLKYCGNNKIKDLYSAVSELSSLEPLFNNEMKNLNTQKIRF